VSNAASIFERRWTRHALKRVDAGLAQRVEEQRSLFDAALVTGTADEIEAHGSAMCRGYAAATKTMEVSGEADDAYLIGFDSKSGMKIAIGHQKSAADRVQELHGCSVIWVSPDEIAAILAGLEGFKQISLVKQFFPGCEVIDVRPHDPAKFESGVAA
jgi:hypothetical protein